MPATMKRGAIPSPRHLLAAATPFQRVGVNPPNFLLAPPQLSFWGNDQYGDCVTAEEAFAKACYSPEIFLPTSEVVGWATAHGYLNGAYLTAVLTTMQGDGFEESNCTYDDGSYAAVNWMNPSILQNAIAQGPVKIGVAADQLDGVVTPGRNGWFALGFTADPNEDHCVSLCGYGSLQWLAQQFGVQVPAGADPAAPGYAMFTWNSIGIIDVPSMQAITAEAWLRTPTTVINPACYSNLVVSNLTDVFYPGPNPANNYNFSACSLTVTNQNQGSFPPPGLSPWVSLDFYAAPSNTGVSPTSLVSIGDIPFSVNNVGPGGTVPYALNAQDLFNMSRFLMQNPSILSVGSSYYVYAQVRNPQGSINFSAGGFSAGSFVYQR